MLKFRDVHESRDVQTRTRRPGRRRLALLLGAGLFQIASAQAQEKNFVGFLTSSAELEAIAAYARDDIAPHAYNVEHVVEEADKPWPYDRNTSPYGHGTTYETISANGRTQCQRRNASNDDRVLMRGGAMILGRVMAYYFTGETKYAKQARDLITEFTDSSGFRYMGGKADYTGDNLCILELSWLTPLLIESAILLEHYPGWHLYHRNELQKWLSKEVYPSVAAISRTRNNNWGNAASFAAWSIGHYLSAIKNEGDPDRVLQEVYPAGKQLSPSEAKWQHRNQQLRRVDRGWVGDSKCAPLSDVSDGERLFGIQEHGGIPDELRRGSSQLGGCDDTHLADDDKAYDYQQAAVSTLVYHAEAMRRHDGDQLYRLTLDSGVPALLQAIRFVIRNPNRSGTQWRWFDWQIGTLRVANRTFQDGSLCDAIAGASDSGAIVGSSTMPFTKVTHADVCR